MPRNKNKKRPFLSSSPCKKDEPYNKRRKSCSSIIHKEIDFDLLCDRKIEFFPSGITRNVISAELAEHSKYFERLFHYHNQEAIVQLPEFLNKPFTAILEFIRQGCTTLTDDNVYDICLAADFLLLSNLNLKELCLKYIKYKTDQPDHAINLFISTKQIENTELQTIALDKIVEHFEKVWRSEEFLNLDIDDVKAILSHDELNCNSELSVLKAITRWINGSDQRTEFFSDLLLSIRVGLLSENEMETLRSMNCISSDSRMSGILEFWPQFLNGNLDNSVLQEYKTKVILPRTPHEIVLVFGGWCDAQGPKQMVQAYNPKSNQWTLWTPNTEENNPQIGIIPKRVYAGCVVVDSKVYLIGGFDGQTALKSTLCFDFNSPGVGWREISCMYDKRYYVGVVHIDGFIYAVGGNNGEERGRLNTGEKFCIQENQWYSIATMNKIRSDASAAELHGKVYVCGGFEGRRYHDSAEFYDPLCNQWTMIKRMTIPRGGVILTRHADHLYAIGGNDGVHRLRSIERYDAETDEWQIVGMMSQQKSNLSAAVINNDIYIIGGWSDEPCLGILGVAERFNIEDRSCTAIAALQLTASATCACVLKGKNHTVQYISKHDTININESRSTENSPRVVGSNIEEQII